MRHTPCCLAVGLAVLGMASVANAANDRFYTATIQPNDVAPNTTQNFNLTLTNNIQSGPSHFLRQVIVTVPAGFTITGPVTVQAPPAAPLPWKATVSGNTVTVVSGSPSDASVSAGEGLTITIPAKAPALSAACPTVDNYTWGISASQVVGGGTGNAYLLTPGTNNPMVKVSCDTFTNLSLSINPNSMQATANGQLLTLTATLTKIAGGAAITGELVTFTVGGAPVTCLSPAITSNGIATCQYAPLPNPLLPAGTYQCIASFAGDAALGLGSSTSSPVDFNINATGTGIQVSNATGTYNGTVNLMATLTSGSPAVPVVGRTVTFSFGTNPAPVASGITDSNGIATASNVSIAGVSPGVFVGFINAAFSGDGTYSGANGSADLTVGQTVTAAITASNKMYDRNNVANPTSCSLTGLIGNDQNTVTCTVSGGATFSSANVGTWTVTGVGITLSGANSGNYALSSTTAQTTASITSKSATVTADPESKVYGAANPTLTATVAGVVNGDTLNYTLATTATATSGVGGYPITVTLGSNPNYNVTPANGTLTVTPAPVTVSFTNLSQTYTGGPLAPGVTTVPAVAYTLTGAPQTNVGSYPVTAMVTDPNYVGSASGTFTITGAANPITFTSMIVTATAPGGNVSFSTSTPAICTVAAVLDSSNNPIPNEAKVTLQSGTWAQCNVLANQGGGGNYIPATQETGVLTITP